MSVICDQKSEPSPEETNAVNFNPTHSDEFKIGKHNKTHNFDNHLKVAVRERLDPSISLTELADKTETDEQL